MEELRQMKGKGRAGQTNPYLYFRFQLNRQFFREYVSHLSRLGWVPLILLSHSTLYVSFMAFAICDCNYNYLCSYLPPSLIHKLLKTKVVSILSTIELLVPITVLGSQQVISKFLLNECMTGNSYLCCYTFMKYSPFLKIMGSKSRVTWSEIAV